jgi:hypothetical protein
MKEMRKEALWSGWNRGSAKPNSEPVANLPSTPKLTMEIPRSTIQDSPPSSKTLQTRVAIVLQSWQPASTTPE